MNGPRSNPGGAPEDPAVEAVLDYLTGAMTADEARRFEAKVNSDPETRAALEYWSEARDRIRAWAASPPPGIERLDELDWDKIKSTARHFAPAPTLRTRAASLADRYFRAAALHSGLAFAFTLLLIFLSVFVVLWSARHPESRRGRLDYAHEENTEKPLGSITVPPVEGGKVERNPRR